MATAISVTSADSGGRCGVIVEAEGEPSLAEWLDSGFVKVQALLHEHGAVILRGFARTDAEGIREVVRDLSGPPLDYTERSSPRSEVAPGVYTSTDYPPEEEIFLHNEQSYNLRFPARLHFYCTRAAEEGGETLLADTRRIYACLPAEVRDRFVSTGYRLVRNYRPHVGLPWQEAFQTKDKAEVERYCAENAIDLEWSGEDELRTSQLRRVVARHPVTGDVCWVNHLTFFHFATLGEDLASLLVDTYGDDGLPTNTYYGDGSPIEPAVMARLRDAYTQECVRPRWQEGDLMIVDNILAAHGRGSFTGRRRVVVSMAGCVEWSRVSATG